MQGIYLDYAATTPCDPRVIEAMEPYFFKEFGNASSIHSFGQRARKAIEDSREKIASLLDAQPEEIVFTSGGTESNNTALFGVAYALQNKGNHIITSSIEHHAVLEPCHVLEKRGFNVTYIPVDKYGLVNPQDIKKAISNKTILISVMHANNEVGTIQPIEEIAGVAKEKGILFHTDAVQTVGHIPVDVKQLGVDLLSFSSHKFYGPKGVGALYIRKGTPLERFLHGGDQEKGRRASTYNTAGIVGTAKALELCQSAIESEMSFQIKLRDRIIREIQQEIPEVFLNGHPTQRLPNNVNLSIRYIEGESVVLSLDVLGIAISTASACTSTSLEPSHVLLAMGASAEVAHSSLRITLGRWTKDQDIDYLITHLPKIVNKLRAMSPLYSSSRK